VKNGKSYCFIVFPDEPTVTEKFASEELASYIEKSTGVGIPLIKEGQLVSVSSQPEHLLVVGKCRLTSQAGLQPEKLENEEILLVSKKGNLYLAGGDSSPLADPKTRNHESFGTLFAVYEFLERYLGVRWYWPGELGEIVPGKKELILPEVSLRQKPSFDFRAVYGYYADDPLISREQSSLWWRRQRLGSSRKGFPGTHAFNEWPERFARTHPEYFALQKDGSRLLDANHGGGHICLTNPEVKKQIVADILKKFKDPSVRAANVWPGDSHGLYGCRCVSCEASRDRSAPKTGTDSRLVWGLVNEIAKEVGKFYPDRWINGGSYAEFADIPEGMEFQPNVAVTICDIGLYWNRKDIEAYKQRITDWKNKVKKIYVWNYYFPSGPGQFVVAAHYINQIWRWCYGKVDGAINELDVGQCRFGGTWPDWPATVLNMYIYFKSLWQVQQDVDKILREYCQDLFGPASRPMLRFHLELEAALKKNYATGVRRDGRYETFWTKLYPPETITRLMTYLDEAEKLTSNEKLYHQRVAVMKNCFVRMKQASDSFLGSARFLRKEIICPAVSEGLDSFDGMLEDKQWTQAGRSGVFVQSVTGQPASTTTEVFLMHDGKNLYLGWKAGLKKGQIIRAERENSTQPVWWDDNFEAFFYAGDTYYQFIITSKGILWDARNGDTGWESKARVKTFVGDEYWSGELIIPVESLTSLPRPETFAGVTWEANFGRVYYFPENSLANGKKITWKEELQMWNPVFEPSFNIPEKSGLIRFP